MNKFFKTVAACALGLAMSFVPEVQVHAQTYSSQTNIIYPIVTLTATGQTSSVIQLGQSPSGNGGSYSVGNISVNGTSLTTATFAVYGSSDGGKTFYPLNVNSVTAPGTVTTTTTVTGPGIYQVNLAGITQVEFVTSGTFTATNLTLTLTVSPNGIIARNGSGGGGSGTVTSFSFPSPTLTPLFTCTVANSTTTPTLTCTQQNAAQNSVYAGPATGGAGVPTFRALVTADLPTATTATNLAGGATGSAPYQSAANTTAFIASPTTSGHTFVYSWQPSGSAIIPAALDLTSSEVQSLIGNGVYVPVGGYYGGTATGVVNVLAITLNSALGTPTLANLIGVPISFIPNINNSSVNPTLNVNGLGAITIVKCGTGTLGIDLVTTVVALVIYNGTNFQLQNPQGGVCQPGASLTFSAPNFSVNGGGSFESTVSTNATSFVGGQNVSTAAILGSASLHGGNNTSSSGSAGGGSTFVQAGSAPSTGLQGFANVQQSFTTASALVATFEAVSMTTTADQVQASPLGTNSNVGIAQTVGGTNTQLYVVSHGKTTARFDGTPVVGDVACYPPASTGTAGLLHDNGSTACTLGESAGVVTGQVSGTGSGATATVEIK